MKILLVDNDTSVRQEMGGILKPIGCDILEAENGVDLLNYLNPDSSAIPDIVFTEILIPELDGYTAAMIARERFDVDVPIIAVTDIPPNNLVDIEDPFTRVLYKPIKRSDILKIVLVLTCPNCCCRILSVDHKSHMHFNCKRCLKRYILSEIGRELSIKEEII